jgi:hypothetical protein
MLIKMLRKKISTSDTAQKTGPAGSVTCEIELEKGKN